MRRSPTREQSGAITALYLGNLDIEILVAVDKSIYMLLFYEPIQGSSGVMRSCMFLSTVDASIWRSTFIIFRLSEKPFSGLVGKAAPPTVILLPRQAKLYFRPLLFTFTSCISKPWPFEKTLRIPLRSWGFHFRFLMSSVLRRRLRIFRIISFVITTFYGGGLVFAFFGFSAMSDLEIYLRTQLLRVLSRLTVSNEESRNCRKISSCSRTSWIEYFLPPDPPIMSTVSALITRLLFYSTLMLAVSCSRGVSKVLVRNASLSWTVSL